ncbi:MAG: DUF3854 domain-containing protein [Terracidiphilus sp.]
MNIQRKLKELKADSKPAPAHRQPKLTLVPSQPTPYNRMLKKLNESGLDAADAKLLHLKPCTAEESMALHLSRIGEGFRISYHNIKGKLIPFLRYRYFDTVGEGFIAGAELRKYDQPGHTGIEVYLPPYKNWEEIAADETKRLILTEGELKAACATKNDFPTISFGGVWSFGRCKGDLRLHKTLEKFKLSGRAVYICFDSDAAKNPEVMRAENRLAQELLNAGAVVHVVRIPPDGPDKVGLDDFIVQNGVKAFQKLLDDTPEWVKSRELHELNAEYVICRDTAAICEITTHRMYSRDRFELLEAPRKVVSENAAGQTCLKPAVKAWLEWPQRSKVDGVTYDPGRPRIFKGKLNQWNDPGIEAIEGDTALFDELFAHLVRDSKQRAWIMQWAAYPLQCRGGRNNVAIMIWSLTQGQGKSLLGETLGWLHGRENYIEIGTDQLASDFNEWQPRRTFVMGSELCGPSTRDARSFADKMKSLITASDILVNEKYEKTYLIPNRDNYFLTSNHLTALHLTKEARRYFVVHATEGKLPQEFYTRFVEWRENGGLSALLYKMLRIDLSGFNPGADAPQTVDMMEMVRNDQSDLQDWLCELHEDYRAVMLRHNWSAVIANNRFATAQQLLKAYLERTPNARATTQQLAQELKAAGFVPANGGVQVRIRDHKGKDTGRRERLWIVRDFKKAAELSPEQIGTEWQAGGGR